MIQLTVQIPYQPSNKCRRYLVFQTRMLIHAIGCCKADAHCSWMPLAAGCWWLLESGRWVLTAAVLQANCCWVAAAGWLLVTAYGCLQLVTGSCWQLSGAAGGFSVAAAGCFWLVTAGGCLADYWRLVVAVDAATAACCNWLGCWWLLAVGDC